MSTGTGGNNPKNRKVTYPLVAVLDAFLNALEEAEGASTNTRGAKVEPKLSISDLANQLISVDRSTILRIVRDLEQSNYIKSADEAGATSSRHPGIKYYELTEDGRAEALKAIHKYICNQGIQRRHVLSRRRTGQKREATRVRQFKDPALA